mmetsp:Transcript_45960/g.84296  ORF Transcript_45960/g.84296 Transcript_45960/m.84296 type:complete len:613 (-) Transcript_45960:113-1951(-)
MALSVSTTITASTVSDWGSAFLAALTPVDILQLLLAAVAVLVLTSMKLPYFRHSKGHAHHFPRLHATQVQNQQPLTAAIAQRPQQQPACLAAKATKTPLSPFVAPTLKAETFCGQVDELLQWMAPTAETDATLQKLSAHVQTVLSEVFPEVAVSSFAPTNLSRVSAFGVAVPEVDIVGNVSPEDMILHLQPFWPKICLRNLSAIKLQKCAIRTCTDLLTNVGGLKFRRSAFRLDEPKVTLLVPAALGFHSESIPIDFALNVVGPLQSAAVLTECGQFEPRAKALILLVRRWAKDRGLCHASSGRLSPYAWMMLCIYFCQVGLEGPLLPPLSAFKSAAQLGQAGMNRERSPVVSPQQWHRLGHPTNIATLSVGDLFRRFLHFYSQDITWAKEGVCPRTGKRASVPLNLSLHVIVDEEGRSAVGPTIEDPLQPDRNLGTSLSAQGLSRVHEELQRAHELVQAGAALSEIVDPWLPPSDDTLDVMSAKPRREDMACSNQQRRGSTDSRGWRHRPSEVPQRRTSRTGDELMPKMGRQVSRSSSSSSSFMWEDEEELHSKLGKAVLGRLCERRDGATALAVATDLLQESLTGQSSHTLDHFLAALRVEGLADSSMAG